MFANKSLLGNYWHLKDFDERLVLSYSQKNKISPLLAKLLLLRSVKEDLVDDFLNANINNNLPDPFLLKDMEKSVNRIISAIQHNENIGIIADYDVDGSTSASILFKFLQHFSNKIIIKIPDRLNEGFGPNIRLMDELVSNDVSIIFTLDCGTSSFNIIDHEKYQKVDIIVIDHHLSESILPNVFSIINPNRYDEESNFNEMAAVGVTFLFLMALRRRLRELKIFNKKIREPNLLLFLDLVALGTVCDVVNLTSYNRIFVKVGLDIIKERRHKGIAQIIDNSNLYSAPTSLDLGFTIGPQLNAASRIGDSSLPFKLLISNDNVIIESISKKLILLNEKRKLIENNVFQEALIQAKKQINEKFILVYGKEWHNGVLGIVASRLITIFYKPTIAISFNENLGIGSARSIHSIDLGSIILNAKNQNLLQSGGGHKMAAGLKIKFENLEKFTIFLKENFKQFPKDLFKKVESFDSKLSVNELNNELLEVLDQIEPYGKGNPEPLFIIEDIKIDHFKVLKEKHLLIFFQNSFLLNLKAICFNCIDTKLGEYLMDFKNHRFNIGCSIKKDNFKKFLQPQIVIKDVMIIN